MRIGDSECQTGPNQRDFLFCIEQFEVHPEAAKFLESIEGNLGVVTIAGPYRTGKSSLAGRALLGNPKAFQADSTVNACTKVSFIWCYS